MAIVESPKISKKIDRNRSQYRQRQLKDNAAQFDTTQTALLGFLMSHVH